MRRLHGVPWKLQARMLANELLSTTVVERLRRMAGRTVRVALAAALVGACAKAPAPIVEDSTQSPAGETATVGAWVAPDARVDRSLDRPRSAARSAVASAEHVANRSFGDLANRLSMSATSVTPSNNHPQAPQATAAIDQPHF